MPDISNVKYENVIQENIKYENITQENEYGKKGNHKCLNLIIFLRGFFFQIKYLNYYLIHQIACKYSIYYLLEHSYSL